MTDSDVDYGPSASKRSMGDLRIPIEPGASVPDPAGQASPRAADVSRPFGDHPSRECAGRFAKWPTVDLVAQAKMQAREQLDPEYTQFMFALAERLEGLLAYGMDYRP